MRQKSDERRNVSIRKKESKQRDDQSEREKPKKTEKNRKKTYHHQTPTVDAVAELSPEQMTQIYQ